jgi:hypothetical protein
VLPLLTTIATFALTAFLVPAIGFVEMTRPAATVLEVRVVTTPTMHPPCWIAVCAAASVLPVTRGTRQDVALRVCLQPFSRPLIPLPGSTFSRLGVRLGQLTREGDCCRND